MNQKGREERLTNYVNKTEWGEGQGKKVSFTKKKNPKINGGSYVLNRKEELLDYRASDKRENYLKKSAYILPGPKYPEKGTLNLGDNEKTL